MILSLYLPKYPHSHLNISPHISVLIWPILAIISAILHLLAAGVICGSAGDGDEWRRGQGEILPLPGLQRRPDHVVDWLHSSLVFLTSGGPHKRFSQLGSKWCHLVDDVIWSIDIYWRLLLLSLLFHSL